MRLVIGQDAEVTLWVAQHIPKMAQHGLTGFGPSTAIGICSNSGALRAGAVFHNYQPYFKSIEMSFASDHPHCLTKSIITGIFSYVFDQLSCNRATSITPRSATSVREFLENLGFVREGVHWRGFGDDDAITYCLRRSAWKRSPYNVGRVLDGQEGRRYTAYPRRSYRRQQRANRVQPADGAVPIDTEQRQ